MERTEIRTAAEILKQLIRIRTVQPEGDERDAAVYIASLFPEERAEKRFIGHEGNRASLVLTFRGRRPGSSVAVTGHMDTITIGDAALWTRSPFGAEESDGCVFGRGASDMKGGLTSMILAARRMLDRCVRTENTVHFCFTADEEVGGTGAKALVGGGYLAGVEELVVVKPTGEKIGLAEKGAIWLRVRVQGRSSHAAMPESGINALGIFSSFADRIRALLGTERKHELLGRSSCTITTLRGGDMPNVVPECCEGTIDIRTLPSVDHDTLLTGVSALARGVEREKPGLRISIEVTNNRPPIGMDENAPLVQSFRSIYAARSLAWKTCGVHYFTDASILVPALGVPFVMLGPGDEGFFHQPDEYVRPESVVRIADVLSEYLATR